MSTPFADITQRTLNQQPTTQVTMPNTSQSNVTNHTQLSNLHSITKKIFEVTKPVQISSTCPTLGMKRN